MTCTLIAVVSATAAALFKTPCRFAQKIVSGISDGAAERFGLLGTAAVLRAKWRAWRQSRMHVPGEWIRPSADTLIDLYRHAVQLYKTTNAGLRLSM